MSFHIVCDSCTDLTEEDLKKGCYTLVPLTLLVDGEEIIDDETFDQADFLAKVAASKESVKSACPAPESYMEACERNWRLLLNRKALQIEFFCLEQSPEFRTTLRMHRCLC